MFEVRKSFEVSAAHHLKLSYESKCENLHGHNWHIVVVCRAKELNQDGMVVDFTHIKRTIMEQLDHKYLNEVLPGMNPTAENIAYWVACQIGEKCVEVSVQESDGNIAIWRRDECV